jgi:ABC-2 type transport system ATP-binding protein
VLLSSHLLHEIEVIADDLVVIGNGRIVAQGTKRDLLGAAGSIVRTPDRTALAAALAADGVTSSYVGRDGLLAQAEADQVGRTAFGAGVPLLELRAADSTGLEEMFLQLTADTSREGALA